MRFFVGGLNWETDDVRLKELFSDEGYDVLHAEVIVDRQTKRSKGFGFVQLSMGNFTEKAVIDSLSGKRLDGRNVTVNQAVPKGKRANGKDSE